MSTGVLSVVSVRLLDVAGACVPGQVIDPPQLPEVPKPAVWSVWLLEQPMWPAVALAVVGLVVAWVLLGRGKAAHAGIAALAGLVLGGGVFVLGSAITTDRERLVEATAELVDVVARSDGPATRALLDDSARLYYMRAPAGLDADQIEQLVANPPYGLVTSHTIKETRGGVDDRGVGRILVRVLVEVEGWNAPVPAWLRVDWRIEDGTPPRVLVIEPIWVSGDNSVRGG